MAYPRGLCIRRFVLAAITSLTILGPTARADEFPEPDPLREAHRARDLKDWDDALLWYDRAYRQDRGSSEARSGYLLSIRQVLRKVRLADPSFQSAILSPEYKLTQAMDFFRNVVNKLQIFYLEPKRVHATRLFRDGLEELCLDLEDPRFREGYLFKRPVPQREAEEMAQALRKEWGAEEVQTPDEAIGHICHIARRIAGRFGKGGMMPNYFKVLIVEFACGACNAQDEYTCYLSPSFGAGSMMMEPTVSAWVAEKGIGRARLSGFDGMTLLGLQAALDRLLREEKVEVVILDLRGNLGGSFEEAVQVAELFLPRGLAIAETASSLKEGRHTYESTNPQPATVPLIVLVDENTASAAELLAGALKVNGRAEIIGRTTLGKSLIQKTLPVSQAPYGTLQVTWARFSLYHVPDLTANGGIAPNVPTDDNEEVALKRARALVMR